MDRHEAIKKEYITVRLPMEGSPMNCLWIILLLCCNRGCSQSYSQHDCSHQNCCKQNYSRERSRIRRNERWEDNCDCNVCASVVEETCNACDTCTDRHDSTVTISRYPNISRPSETCGCEEPN